MLPPAGNGVTACTERDGFCVANASYFLEKGALDQLDTAVAEAKSCQAAEDDAREKACHSTPMSIIIC